MASIIAASVCSLAGAAFAILTLGLVVGLLLFAVSFAGGAFSQIRRMSP